MLVHADGAQMPFPRQHFGSAISNSVLEHIPDVDAVLLEAARVLRPGAPFVFCVPNYNFTQNLSVFRALDKIKLKPLAKWYRAFFNRISRHHHCDPPKIWKARLVKAGFELEDWGHYFGLPSAIIHAVTRRWLLVQSRWNLAFIDRIVRKYYREPIKQEDGAYTFFFARRLK